MHNRLAVLRFLCTVLLWGLGVLSAVGQETAGVSHAVITPFQDIHNDAGLDDALHLSSQKFIILIYQNALAVYSEAMFVNRSGDSVCAAFALPSHGYRISIEEKEVFNARLYGPRVWVAGERLQVATEETDDAEWYTIHPAFAPGQTKVLKALCWIPIYMELPDAAPPSDTAMIPPGVRHWQIRLSDASAWKDNVDQITVRVLVHDGITMENSGMRMRPKNYDLQGSAISWSFTNVEPGEFQNIHCAFQTPSTGDHVESAYTKLNTLQKLSAEMTGPAYDELLLVADQQ